MSLVIDRSGSMMGDKLTNAKAAAHDLVDSLSAHDQLSIVSYGQEVSRVAEPTTVTDENRPRLHDAIDSISAEGGTFLSGGYELGRDLALASRGPNTINRVVLLSDGLANEGVTEPHELASIASAGLERGVSLTTMGVGVDYGEELMEAIATAGAGNYYFIAEDRQIGQIMADELAGLKSSVARQTRLTFVLPPGVQLVDVHGFDYRQRGDEVTVDLDAFFGGQQKDLLMDLDVALDAVGTQDLLETRLRYVDVTTDQEVEARTHASATVGHEVRPNVAIMTRVQQIRTADAFSHAMRIYDSGNRFDAADLLEQQATDNRRFVSRYDVDATAFERVGKELDSLADALRRTERNSYRGSYYSKAVKYRSKGIKGSTLSF
jgi:Ca-activated chloride channel family protein